MFYIQNRNYNNILLKFQDSVTYTKKLNGSSSESPKIIILHVGIEIFSSLNTNIIHIFDNDSKVGCNFCREFNLNKKYISN